MDMGRWKGLFDWSMQYQDGSRAPAERLEELSADKREWLSNALKEVMKDFVDRMREIKGKLEGKEGEPDAASLQEKEQMMDELTEIVENVDYARDLHTIGGLPTLLSLMSDPAPSIRWRAAGIVAACAANNPPVQRWFMEGGALPPLLGLLQEGNATCRAKAILAVSALVRHYQPGLEAFRLAGGLEKLVEVLGTPEAAAAAAGGGVGDDAAGGDAGAGGAAGQDQGAAAAAAEAAAAEERLIRKALVLLVYMCQAHPADAAALASLGAVPKVAVQLRCAGGTQEAALQLLLEIGSHPQGWGALKADGGQLEGQLLAVQQQLEGLSGVDQAAAAEELALVQQLRALLAAEAAPAVVKAGQAHHIEVDEALDYGPGQRKSVATGSGAQQQQVQQQPGHQDRQQTAGALAIHACTPTAAAVKAGGSWTGKARQQQSTAGVLDRGAL